MHHPIQPVETSNSGAIRFKANAIVDYLLNNGGINMNDLAMLDFSQDDREQFAQLIGYSVDGFGTLSYASVDTISAVDMMVDDNYEDPKDAQIAALKQELFMIRSLMKEPIARLYGMHPEDVMPSGSGGDATC